MTIPTFAAETVLLGPEAAEEHVRRLLSQRLCPRPARRLGARSGEKHERVLIGGLLRADRSPIPDGREPVSGFAILERVAQPDKPVVDELRAARAAEQMPEREDVRHPRCDPEAQGLGAVRDAVVIQPGEASRDTRRARDLEQAVALAGQVHGCHLDRTLTRSGRSTPAGAVNVMVRSSPGSRSM